MKAKLLQSGLLTLIMAVTLSSCIKDQCERMVTYVQLTPIYQTKDEIRAGSLTNEAARELCNPGQIYYYNQHIFINERGEGVHVINNLDPENPTNIAFLNIPGNDDIAIKNGILYANNYMDLLAIDITNFSNASLISRTEDIFTPQWEDVNTGEVLIEWKSEEITETMDCNNYASLYRSGGGFFRFNNSVDFAFASADVSIESAVSASQAVGGVGTGGSMARFTIVSDYLYALEDWEMDVISLVDPKQPSFLSSVNMGWGIETIFPLGDKLFIGSQTGMFIYENSNPANPTFLSAFEHARACDPVFVDDDIAYVTLRDGTPCTGASNQMDLVDISNIEAPVLLETFPMDHPHGLSIRGDRLFLCEGENGLKVYDITDPMALDENLLAERNDFEAIDVISLPNSRQTAIVIGRDGFYQFEYDESTKGLKLLSKIEVVEKP